MVIVSPSSSVYSCVLLACFIIAFSVIDFISWFELVQVGCSILSLLGITEHYTVAAVASNLQV